MKGDDGCSQRKSVKTTDGRTVKGESESEENIRIFTEPITVEAIKVLKPGKAPREGEVCAELLAVLARRYKITGAESDNRKTGKLDVL